MVVDLDRRRVLRPSGKGLIPQIMQDTTSPPNILYLATTFPRLSETFLQREVVYLRETKLHLDIRSLWGGQSNFEDTQLQTSSIRNLPKALKTIPTWIVRNPEAFQKVLGKILNLRLPMVQNWMENFWGFAWALQHADSFMRKPPDLVHATWGTMPAAAALALKYLIGVPFSMEAHAYDVYKFGGDWLLDIKAMEAKFVRSSTQSTLNELMSRRNYKNSGKYHLIRRGIQIKPLCPETKCLKNPLRIITVGRMVEKKNIAHQLDIYNKLQGERFPFQAKVVGEGPLLQKLKEQAKRLGLNSQVQFTGSKTYTEVERLYRDSDVFLFSGVEARNGDRDGLPNVIAEAMAHGLIVITTPIDGACEAISDRNTGFVMPYHDVEAWVR
ncbi:MAG: glycosyltransferase family 4 protein, partial [Opitutae bacterium]